MAPLSEWRRSTLWGKQLRTQTPSTGLPHPSSNQNLSLFEILNTGSHTIVWTLETLRTLVGMGSTALTAAVALPQKGHPSFPQGSSEVPTKKQTKRNGKHGFRLQFDPQYHQCFKGDTKNGKHGFRLQFDPQYHQWFKGDTENGKHGFRL